MIYVRVRVRVWVVVRVRVRGRVRGSCSIELEVGLGLGYGVNFFGLFEFGLALRSLGLSWLGDKSLRPEKNIRIFILTYPTSY